MTIKRTLVSSDMRVFALYSLMELHRSKETGTCLKTVYPFCTRKGCYNLRPRIDAQTDDHCARRYFQDNDGFRNCKFIFNSIAAKHY